ncbi:pyridoxamine 5'-phosphate oxidase family protein [Halobacterium litoreum]|uniref:Pyridoxamine 5'-phosphate oxidase family protein n=1 Tax=Halobacterium litoreum TaxID=2039234 RepID=A0ABD5NG69_9EURY|nr:pyridoxamine 5'-phosphate oxidase family protein [Halobacterium litoreum]UHH12873.1 pyridoxamine 5'-phosphate oxidase family protein [Halobacterium litoreum]
MEHAEYVYTTGMDESAVERHLRDADHCVLSLADGGDAYAVPVSCHWDGERVLLRLSEHGDESKFDYLDATESACVVFYGADGDDSWSVLLRGDLVERETPDEATLNEWFGPFRVFDEAVEDVSFRVFALEPEAVTGRETT